MRWYKSSKEPNVVDTDERYVIACVPMPRDTFAFTLYWEKQLLGVVRNVPDTRSAKHEAFTEMKACAEAHLAEQATLSPTPPPSAPRDQHPA
jgi:hypothetical protein